MRHFQPWIPCLRGPLRALLWLGLLLIHCAALAEPPECDSCRFRVERLERPFSLAGRWLFTRDDAPGNAAPDADLSTWRTVVSPGPWKPVYADGKVYSVGWYRANIEFSPALIGEEVLFLVDAYMGRINVFLDGSEIYRRPGETGIHRYFSVQPVPVRFRITQTRHVLAFRVDTPLMKGVYQLPFDLRRYDNNDTSLYWYQFAGGEARLIASSAMLFFGLFFLVVYFKTRYRLYLVAALNSLVVIPFFAMPGDHLLRVFPPEPLFYLHYVGLCVAFTSYLFCQFFYRFTPRINWIFGLACLTTSAIIVSNVFRPNLQLFQIVRGIHLQMLTAFLLVGAYLAWKGVRLRKPGAGILLVGISAFAATAIHDTMLALGYFNSIGLLFSGALTLTACMLIVSTRIFADTFIENKNLIANLSRMNDRLEGLVEERTRKLEDALLDLGLANQNLRTSYEELNHAKDELVRNEKLAALGSLVAGVAHELNTPLGNALMASSTLVDQLQSLKQEIETRGAKRSSIDSFLKSVERSMDITMRSLDRSASLVTSFKQIAVNQATLTRARFNLRDLIGNAVAIIEPTLAATPYRIESQVPETFEMDSFSVPLGEVLVNLVNNAVTHGFDGRMHGMISILAEAGESGRVVIRVRDDGNGISEEHLPRIFDPFFTTRLGQGGAGLGLHIVHNLVTQVLGGSLRVKTRRGQGSEFILDIPLSAPVAQRGVSTREEVA